jgi:hypothetical protein
MKRLIIFGLVLLVLAGCSAGEPSRTETATVARSDPFPAEWIGEWVCTKSEWRGFIKEGYEVEFSDYKNKIVKTWDNEEGHINKVNNWARYNADENTLWVYTNEDLEGETDNKFEIAKQTEAQIVLYVTGYGSEIILEKK